MIQTSPNWVTATAQRYAVSGLTPKKKKITLTGGNVKNVKNWQRCKMNNKIYLSKNGLYTLEGETWWTLADNRGNAFELTLSQLTELADFLAECSREENEAFQNFLDLEQPAWEKNAQEWRNFTTTGDPNISPERYYAADKEA